MTKQNTSFRFDEITKTQLEEIARFEGKTMSIVIAELVGKRFNEKVLAGEFEGLYEMLLMSVKNKKRNDV